MGIGYNIPLLKTEKLKMLTPNDLPNLLSVRIKLRPTKESEILLDSFRKIGVKIKY